MRVPAEGSAGAGAGAGRGGAEPAGAANAPPLVRSRHVAVTGAGTGIGRAIALRLAREGARLSLLARDTTRLERTAAQARENAEAAGGGAGPARSAGRTGSSAVFVRACDIRDRAAVDAAFGEAARVLGPLDALVANSGIGGPNEPGPGDRFDDLILTNLTGTYSCLRAAERHLAPGPSPRHLLVISSVLARFGVPGYTGYCASKAGLLGLVRAMALELAPRGVRVNAICPGWVDTDMAREGIRQMAAAMGTSEEEAHRTAMQQVPLGRMSTPEEVAAMVAWLLSPGAAGITGQGLDLNGGAWMG